MIKFNLLVVVVGGGGAAKQAKSSNDLLSKLQDFGFPSTPQARSFAEEILARVPRKAAGLNVGS